MPHCLEPAGGHTYPASISVFRPLEEPHPRSRQRVKALPDGLRQDGPASLRQPIGVAASSFDFPVAERKGSLFMGAPEEVAHAILYKVAAGVSKMGARISNAWSWVSMSVPLYIGVVQVQLQAYNARRVILQDNWSMARTAQQQCYEVVVFGPTLPLQLARQPQSKEISDKFCQNVNLADSSQEDHSERVVNDALAYYTSILCVSRWCRSCVT